MPMFNKNADNEHKPPFEGQAFLITAGDSVEASIIESKLEAAQIPVYKKYREPGAYLNLVLGNTSMGVDLFVSEERVEEATEILESASDISDEDILSDPSFSDEFIKNKNEEELNNISKKAKLIAAVFIVAVIALIILYLLNQ